MGAPCYGREVSKTRPHRAAFRETPTAEALAIDRWMFGHALGAGPGDVRVVRPGAFGLFFDLPDPLRFDPDAVEDGIAVLRICGPLEQRGGWWTSYEDITRESRAALEHPETRVLVHRIDSPGGVAAGMGQTHRELVALQKEIGKPIIAYADEQACSAAYNLACAASEVWTSREGVLGSIGVILCTVDESAMLENMGVKVRYVVTGARKADLHPGAPITDRVLEVAQKKVDELGRHFFRAVARRRGTTPEAVAGLEAAVFSGKRAVAVGLADGVADWREFLSTLRAGNGATVP